MIVLLVVFFVAVLIIIILLVAPGRQGAKKRPPVDTAVLAKQARVAANERFAALLEKEAASLQKNLQARAASIDKEFTTKLNVLNNKQLKEYEQALSATLQKTLQELHAASQVGDQQRKAFEQTIAEQTTQAKADIIAKVDKNSAEILISYLAEVAGTLDYQQQKDYLFEALEANKTALKKDIEQSV